MNKIKLSLNEEEKNEDEALLKVIFANAPLESKKKMFSFSLSEVYIARFSVAVKHRRLNFTKANPEVELDLFHI